MANSYCETERAICPECGHNFQNEVWLIVDAAERPDLLRQIQEGALRKVTCPHCGELAGTVDSPLLIYQPERAPRLVYAPSESHPEESAAALVEMLRGSVGPGWRDEWTQHILRVCPPTLLPAAMNDDPRLIAEALLEQTARELVQLEHERPDLHFELCSAFGMLE